MTDSRDRGFKHRPLEADLHQVTFDSAQGGRPVAGTRLQRCEHCGAGLVPVAPWCARCLRPRVNPPRSRSASGVNAPRNSRPGGAGPAGGQLGPPSEPSAVLDPPSTAAPAAGWPCSACATQVAWHLDHCTACGAPFLAVEPPLCHGPAGHLLRLSRPARLGLAAAVSAGAAAAAVLTSLLVHAA